MKKGKTNFQLKLIVSVILTLGLSISFQSLLASWQEPTQNAPGGNIAKPINTSLVFQSKQGGMDIAKDFSIGSDLIVDGRMAINSATSSSRLKILDNNPGTDLYIQGNGVNPELSLGGSSNYWSIYSDETNTGELRFWRGDNRMALTDSGTLKIKEICDENGGNCVDVSSGIGDGVLSSYNDLPSGALAGYCAALTGSPVGSTLKLPATGGGACGCLTGWTSIQTGYRSAGVVYWEWYSCIKN